MKKPDYTSEKPFEPTRGFNDSWADPVEWKRPLRNFLLAASGVTVGRKIIHAVKGYVDSFADSPKGTSVD